jgi:hypothetical protein
MLISEKKVSLLPLMEVNRDLFLPFIDRIQSLELLRYNLFFLPYEKEMQTRLLPTYYYIFLSDYIFDVNFFLPVSSWIELTENSTDHTLLAGS